MTNEKNTNIPRGSQLNPITLYTDGTGQLTKTSAERLLERIAKEASEAYAEQENSKRKN